MKPLWHRHSNLRPNLASRALEVLVLAQGAIKQSRPWSAELFPVLREADGMHLAWYVGERRTGPRLQEMSRALLVVERNLIVQRRQTERATFGVENVWYVPRFSCQQLH